MPSVVVALICTFLQYAAVEGTYGLFPEFSGSFSSHSRKPHNGWMPLSSFNGFSKSYSSIYDTLNSEYSHALYPFGRHNFFRVPVKGGLTVVPAPKNLELFKGFTTYGGYPELGHSSQIKESPLQYYGGLYSNTHNHLKNVDGSLVSALRTISTHGLKSGLHLKNIHKPTYSIKQLDDDSYFGVHGHSLYKDVKDIQGSQGYDIDNPILKTHKHSNLAIASHHDHNEHIHGHDLKHDHQSDIGHGLSHIRTSGIESGYHSVDIAHSIPKSDLPIHGSSHSVVDDGKLDHVIEGLDIEHGYHTPLHKLHLVGDHGSYLNGEVVHQTDKTHGSLTRTHHKIDEILKDVKTQKGSIQDYTAQEHIDGNTKPLNDEKYHKKPLHLPQTHKKDIKLSSHTYAEQKKTDITSIYPHKDSYDTYQTDKDKSDEHHFKGNSHAKHSIHRPTHPVESYPRFPHTSKRLDSYDRVKYAGGRHPVRPVGENLQKTYFNSKQPSKHEDLISERHPSYDNVQHKIEQQEHHDDYKQTGGAGHKSDPLTHPLGNPYAHTQKPKNSNYKSGSGQPRGRTKIYRNYEKPRASSYEIEILHSDSSDHKLEELDDSNTSFDDLNKEGEEEEFPLEDESDGFDSEESGHSLIKTQTEEEDADKIVSNSDNEE